MDHGTKAKMWTRTCLLPLRLVLFYFLSFFLQPPLHFVKKLSYGIRVVCIRSQHLKLYIRVGFYDRNVVRNAFSVALYGGKR